ncbi:hypothetical protein [Paraburkholderia sp. J63]|uniref:hypothetical protein n=1 Tax=Paraburkholderia sp. J63 TaxID=2805434 RepID=UPI002ABD1D6B|nr:hypothetical protein [Paraburkholderia sp. J63]
MPVDFLRVPPKVSVPEVSRPSILGWALLLCLMILGCTIFAVFVWPAGKPDSLLFWFCSVGLPILTWAFLLSCRLAYTFGRVNSALATNKTSDQIEAQCHESSSQPIAVLGHAWRFSSKEEENSVDSLVDKRTKLLPVPSVAMPNTDVIARWLDVPDRQFHAGNALTEHARQTEVCDWLLRQLASGIAPQLLALPRRATVKVDLCIDSVLDPTTAKERLLSLLNESRRALRVEVNEPESELPLFRADEWFDDSRSDAFNLLVALQLRNVTDEVLASGVAEAGSMLLVSSRFMARRLGLASPVFLHRPARGALADVVNTLKLATRWGRTAFDAIGTTWRTGLAEDSTRTIRSSCRFGRSMGTIDLDATVGDAGVARAWLATTLAVANAALTDEPQLVVTQEGDVLTALICEKQT